ncbi:flavohemoprotein [Rhodococcoides trifolii]|uniref:nitric oxide dioxygenase n=1 Tax=Rhodococcoides trifolii TaxID=908250 RepID=A0A917G872_9NOCA|nr:FAD-binding oxidoreductase [Rhodococcus trifolii]GGG28471.1 flavohemoprotein [Rhodococcus trifolii]
MDPRAISLVRTSFKAVAAVDGGPDKLTSSFYAFLFARNPEIRELFTATMTGQRERLVTAIAYVVDHLDDLEASLPFLEQLGRDHRKYGIVDRHYAAVGAALILALERFAGTELWTDEVAAAWDDAIAIIAGTMMNAANAETGPAAVGATVIEHVEVLQDVAIIRLQLDEPLKYAAGQYISVQVPSRPRMWRYLSPAIPANDAGQIEFHVRRVSGGWVSPAIVQRTEVGERWVVGSPLGSLGVAGAGGRNMLMVGSGTGLAPLRAQIMEMSARSQNPKVHLFMGGTYPCDLYDFDTMSDIARSNPWLTVVPVSENDTDPWWHDGGPVPALSRQLMPSPVGVLAASFGSWAERDVQIAGSPSMIAGTVDALVAGGTPHENIRHDPLI